MTVTERAWGLCLRRPSPNSPKVFLLGNFLQTFSTSVSTKALHVVRATGLPRHVTASGSWQIDSYQQTTRGSEAQEAGASVVPELFTVPSAVLSSIRPLSRIQNGRRVSPSVSTHSADVYIPVIVNGGDTVYLRTASKDVKGLPLPRKA